MYEIWSLGHKPFEDYGNSEVNILIFVEKCIVKVAHFR